MTLKRPRATPIEPVATSGSAKWVEMLKNLVVVVVAITLVAAAGLAFVTFVILRRALMAVWSPIERAVSTIMYMIVGIVMMLVEQIIGWVVVGLLVGGAMYLALEYNPQLRMSINNFAAKVQRNLSDVTGLDIPELKVPSIKDAMDILTRKGSSDNLNPLHPENIEAQVHQLERIKDISLPSLNLPQINLPQWQMPNITLPEIPSATQLERVVKRNAIPAELEPLMQVTMQPQVLAQFKALADSGTLQKNAETVLPLLQYGLYSRNEALSSASVEALANLKTPQSKKMLMEYQQIISQALHDASNPRH